MASESITPRKRKRDRLGKLLYCCIGRRKPAQWDYDNESGFVSDTTSYKLGNRLQEQNIGTFQRRSRSLESLPPILLVPIERDGWLTTSSFPITEEGAVVLHQGHGSKRVKQVYYKSMKRKSLTLDDTKLSVSLERQQKETVVVNKQEGSCSISVTSVDRTEEEEINGWDIPEKVEIAITVTSPREDSIDPEGEDGLTIELPTIRRPKNAPQIPDSEKGSSLEEMKHRASITTIS